MPMINMLIIYLSYVVEHHLLCDVCVTELMGIWLLSASPSIS